MDRLIKFARELGLDVQEQVSWHGVSFCAKNSLGQELSIINNVIEFSDGFRWQGFWWWNCQHGSACKSDEHADFDDCGEQLSLLALAAK